MYWSGCMCVCVCIYYVPVNGLPGCCFFYCNIFIVYMNYASLREVFFGMCVHWFNLVFHKVGMHALICRTFEKYVFNWYLWFNAKWSRNSHLLSKISFIWDMPFFSKSLSYMYWLLDIICLFNHKGSLRIWSKLSGSFSKNFLNKLWISK